MQEGNGQLRSRSLQLLGPRLFDRLPEHGPLHVGKVCVHKPGTGNAEGISARAAGLPKLHLHGEPMTPPARPLASNPVWTRSNAKQIRAEGYDPDDPAVVAARTWARCSGVSRSVRRFDSVMPSSLARPETRLSQGDLSVGCAKPASVALSRRDRASSKRDGRSYPPWSGLRRPAPSVPSQIACFDRVCRQCGGTGLGPPVGVWPSRLQVSGIGTARARLAALRGAFCKRGRVSPGPARRVRACRRGRNASTPQR